MATYRGDEAAAADEHEEERAQTASTSAGALVL